MANKLPKQLREQLARGDALMAQTPTDDPAADPDTGQGETQETDVTTQMDTEQPVPAQEPVREDWKAKYHTLQGMFNAEVPRLHKELKEARAVIANLQQGPSTPAVEPQHTEPAVNADALPAALVDVLGEDAARAVMSTLRDSAARAVNPINAKLEAADKRIEVTAQAQAENARTAFFNALAMKVPDWRDVDVQAEWKQYLSGREPLSRHTRQEGLTEAANDGDVDGVAAFFNAYKALHQPVVASRSLERQVTPQPGGSGPAPATTQSFTREQVKNFYTRVALGKVKPDDAAKTEQAISAAVREGRIR